MIAVKSLERVWGQQLRCEISRKGLGTSRVAVHFQGMVWGPAG